MRLLMIYWDGKEVVFLTLFFVWELWVETYGYEQDYKKNRLKKKNWSVDICNGRMEVVSCLIDYILS